MQSTKKQLEAKDETISNLSKIVSNGSQEENERYLKLIEILVERQQKLYVQL
jgi:hypothetical protein